MSRRSRQVLVLGLTVVAVACSPLVLIVGTLLGDFRHERHRRRLAS